MPTCLALLEIANLAPALVVADRCAKAAGVEILGIESTHGAEQCLKLAGAAGAVREAGEAGVRLARRMGTRARADGSAGRPGTMPTATQPPAFIPSLESMT